MDFNKIVQIILLMAVCYAAGITQERLKGAEHVKRAIEQQAEIYAENEEFKRKDQELFNDAEAQLVSYFNDIHCAESDGVRAAVNQFIDATE